MDVVEEGINTKTSRSSSISSTPGNTATVTAVPDVIPPSDITNRLESVLPSKHTHHTIATTPAISPPATSIDQNRSPERLVVEQPPKPPTAQATPTTTTTTTTSAPISASSKSSNSTSKQSSDPATNPSNSELASRVSLRDSPPLRHRRRNRNRAQRAKTLDLSEISDVLRRRKVISTHRPRDQRTS